MKHVQQTAVNKTKKNWMPKEQLQHKNRTVKLHFYLKQNRREVFANEIVKCKWLSHRNKKEWYERRAHLTIVMRRSKTIYQRNHHERQSDVMLQSTMIRCTSCDRRKRARNNGNKLHRTVFCWFYFSNIIKYEARNKNAEKTAKSSSWENCNEIDNGISFSSFVKRSSRMHIT